MNLKKIIRKPFRMIKKMVGYEEIYTIAIRKRGESSLYEGNEAPFSQILISDDYWYADPIVISEDNNTYLFCEAYEKKENVGRIAISEIDSEGNATNPQIILEEEYHMSFPTVFCWNNMWYMVPETSENESINLYKAILFPSNWELVKSWKINKKIVDSVVLYYDQREVSFLASEYQDKDLFKYRFVKYKIKQSGNELLLEWEDDFNDSALYNYHDRIGGTPIEIDNKKVIITQSGTDIDYGVSIRYRNIDNLKSIKVKEIGPKDISITGIKKSDCIGVHTYAVCDDFEIIDMRYLKH